MGSVGTLREHATKCEFALLPCPNKCEEGRDSSTSQPNTLTPQLNAAPSQPSTSTPQLNAAPSQPGTLTLQLNAAPPQPSTSTPQLNAAPSQPGTLTLQLNAAPPQPSTSTPQLNAASSQPSTSTPQPNAAPPQPSTSTPQPNAAPPQPSTSTPQPNAAPSQPSTSTPQIVTKPKVRYFLRKDLGKHVDEDCPNRKYQCEDCGLEDTYTYITTSHYDDCPVVVLPCPKRPCTDMHQRQYMERHIETECKHAIVCCKYKELGCEQELKRGDMTAHEEDDKIHLHMAIDTTAKLSSSIAEISRLAKGMTGDVLTAVRELSAKFSNVEDQLSNKIFESNSVTLKVDDIPFDSPFFYITPRGYYGYLTVCLHHPAGDPDTSDATQVSVDITLAEGDYDDDLSWPLKGDVTITLLNQLEDKNHYSKTKPIDVERYDECVIGFPDFISRSELDLNTTKNTHYLKDGIMYVRVSVKLIDTGPNWLRCTDI